MNGEVFEPSGHEGISLVRGQKGNLLGYHVEGVSGLFDSLADALAARDGPDNDLDPGHAPDLPDPDRPRSGRSR